MQDIFWDIGRIPEENLIVNIKEMRWINFLKKKKMFILCN